MVPLLLGVAHGAEAWPWHSGPDYDFHVKGVTLARDWANQPPTLSWKTPMTDEGYACPSYSEDALFIVDHLGSKDIVRSLALKDGREIWRFEYEDTDRSLHGFTRPAPTLYKGHLYTVSRVGNVHCLEQQTGRKVWSKNYGADFGGVSPNHSYSAPAGVWGDLVFLQPGGAAGNTVALNRLTGALVWRGGNDEKVGYSLPVVVAFDGVETLLCYSANTMMGLNPKTGATLWTFPRPHAYGNNVIQPVVDGNRIFTGATDFAGSVMVELKDGKPQELWKNMEICPVFTTPVRFGKLLFGTSSGVPARPEGLYCLDAETGETRWKVKLFEHGQLLRVGDVLLVLDGQSGALVMFEPSAEAFREITRFTPLGGRNCWSDFFIVKDRLIVRNVNELACFRLPAE